MNRFGFYTPLYDLRNDTYKVQTGDTLYTIAKKYNVSVNSLVEANSLENTTIYPYQVIVIPVKVNNGGMYFEEYVIKPNDTIEIISDKLDVDPEMISRYNDISRLVLDENQVLKIPRDYKTYTVVATDTLTDILGKTNMTAEELIEANKDKWLKVGTKINIK